VELIPPYVVPLQSKDALKVPDSSSTFRARLVSFECHWRGLATSTVTTGSSEWRDRRFGIEGTSALRRRGGRLQPFIACPVSP
jgi:hypothetical protein